MRVMNKEIEKLLVEVEPIVVELVGEIKKSILKLENGRWNEKYDNEFYTEYVKWDMIKGLEKFVGEGVEFVSVEARVSKKGNLVIYSTWNFEGVEHYINTEVIYAGGHNIQKLHYRYLVHSDLPRLYNGTPEADILKKRIKVLKKRKELLHERSLVEDRIKEKTELLKYNKSLSHDEVVEIVKPTFLPDNFESDPIWFKKGHGSKENYLYWLNEENNHKVELWYKVNIERVEETIKRSNISIGIINKKLTKLS